MIDLCTLGTGGTMPLPDRALASLYVRVGGRAVLVDCGEGNEKDPQQYKTQFEPWSKECVEAFKE